MSGDRTPLELQIRDHIARDGPIPVSDFMDLCLYDPEHGYYRRRPAIGAAGDFITAPEISQMFGELIGLWSATVWHSLGEPDPVMLIELGPGRGTMMADALRAVRAVPAFRQAVRVHFVESSAELQMRQRDTLAGATDVTLRWHATLAEVPAGPAIILANEFFDAWPIHQAELRETGWHLRAVTLNAGGELALTIADEPIANFEPPAALRRVPAGTIFEWRTDDFAVELARRTVDFGAALVIDYGHAASAPGDTFQAVRSHRYASPLALPGLTDLTAHVDFEALARAARGAGARVDGPVEQGTFLRRLGIDERSAVLTENAAEQQRPGIAAARRRLIGNGPNDMGTIFKAIGIASPQIELLPGFTE